MRTATLKYLNHIIRVELPDPKDSNQIAVMIHRAEGTYDPNEVNSYLGDWLFTGTSQNPNEWVLEALKDAIDTLAAHGENYFDVKPATYKLDESKNYKDVPF